MSTLNEPNYCRACAALLWPTPPGHISNAHYTGKDGTRVRMNVGAHQEKEKNEKTGRRRENTGQF